MQVFKNSKHCYLFYTAKKGPGIPKKIKKGVALEKDKDYLKTLKKNLIFSKKRICLEKIKYIIYSNYYMLILIFNQIKHKNMFNCKLFFYV